MVTEEKDLKNQIEQRVVDFTNKIDVLTEELGLPKFQVIKMRFIYLCILICIGLYLLIDTVRIFYQTKTYLLSN